MRASRLAILLVALAACGSSPRDELATPDLSASTQLGDGGAAADLGLPCVTASDCPSLNDWVCGYAIDAGCAATSGTCLKLPPPPRCQFIRALCGCGGARVTGDGDCDYPQGWASGPTASTSYCSPLVDGGTD